MQDTRQDRKETARLLLIGIGRWGRNHLKTLTRLVDDLYVVDADPDQLKAGREFSIPEDHLSTDYRHFLDRVDAVDIVTPADNHLAISRVCFEKKKDVFVEKPIAMTTVEAREMIRQAEAGGAILQVGHLYRYHPSCLAMKRIIRDGSLGTVQYAYGHFMGFKRPRTDVGVTQTDAIHFFDLFNFLFDEPPQSVTAVVKNYLNLPFDDTSISVLDYRGKIVYIEAGYMPPETRRDIAVVGDKASLYCNFQKNTLLLCENRHERQGEKCVALEGEARDVPVVSEEPLALELKAFLDSIRDRSRPMADGQAGYEALKIVEACYESSKLGKKIDINWVG
jgi:UDP-2-acetamido-3-amino-2,3-dideoxy-glucuronate N-acetyltransferase